jgi:hypothetical protein
METNEGMSSTPMARREDFKGESSSCPKTLSRMWLNASLAWTSVRTMVMVDGGEEMGQYVDFQHQKPERICQERKIGRKAKGRRIFPKGGKSTRLKIQKNKFQLPKEVTSPRNVTQYPKNDRDCQDK